MKLVSVAQSIPYHMHKLKALGQTALLRNPTEPFLPLTSNKYTSPNRVPTLYEQETLGSALNNANMIGVSRKGTFPICEQETLRSDCTSAHLNRS